VRRIAGFSCASMRHRLTSASESRSVEAIDDCRMVSVDFRSECENVATTQTTTCADTSQISIHQSTIIIQIRPPRVRLVSEFVSEANTEKYSVTPDPQSLAPLSCLAGLASLPPHFGPEDSGNGLIRVATAYHLTPIGSSRRFRNQPDWLPDPVPLARGTQSSHAMFE